eukprot:10729200-Alexandrium_andersonii.AAC.1
MVYGYRAPNPFSAEEDRGSQLGVDSEGRFMNDAARAQFEKRAAAEVATRDGVAIGHFLEQRTRKGQCSDPIQ